MPRRGNKLRIRGREAQFLGQELMISSARRWVVLEAVTAMRAVAGGQAQQDLLSHPLSLLFCHSTSWE